MDTTDQAERDIDAGDRLVAKSAGRSTLCLNDIIANRVTD